MNIEDRSNILRGPWCRPERPSCAPRNVLAELDENRQRMSVKLEELRKLLGELQDPVREEKGADA